RLVSRILELGIEFTFAIGNLDLAPLRGDHFVSLTESKPGKPAVLKPFMLINNGNGTGHCGHTDIYLGKYSALPEDLGRLRDISAKGAQRAAELYHPDAVAFLDGHKRWRAWVPDEINGTPMVGHAMATQKTGRSTLQRVPDRLSARMNDEPFTGVFVEPMKDFFDRFPRGDYYIVEDKRMTPEMAQNGLRAFQKIQGKEYDSNLNMSGERFYCSEAAVEFIRGAYEGTFKEPPYLPTTRVQQKVLGWTALDELITEPMAFGISPHLNLVHGNASGLKDYIDIRQKVVLPESLSVPRIPAALPGYGS
ncbi:MAG: hypothetical protein AAFY60_10490, partial [Myxococcota bacterium]